MTLMAKSQKNVNQTEEGTRSFDVNNSAKVSLIGKVFWNNTQNIF